MAATGAGFALASQFWPLLIIAFVGTLMNLSLVSYLLTLLSLGWLLIIGGALKAAYDLLILLKFRKLRPPEEGGGSHELKGLPVLAWCGSRAGR
jgi:hypothetical protein